MEVFAVYLIFLTCMKTDYRMIENSGKHHGIINLMILGLCFMIITSCAAPLYFEKSEPPEISASIKPCRIAFINIFDYTWSEAVKSENQNVYRSAINEFAREMNRIGSSDSIYKFFVADTLFKGVPVQDQTLMLPADTVELLTTVFKADYLVTLDSISLYLMQDESDNSDEDGNSSGFGSFYLVSDFFLSLYDLSGNMVNRSEVSMTSGYGNRTAYSYFSGLLPSFSRASTQAGELGISAADEYADRFYPTVTQEERYVYTGGKLKEANSLIVREQWDKAEAILRKLASGKNTGIARKAEHNLSVLGEIRESVKATPGNQ